MLGRPNCDEPVLANSLAGAWLKTSVATDLTNVRSSTTSAMCGKSADTHAPDWPCLRELADRPQQLGMFLGEDIHERESASLDERVGDRLAAIFLKLGLEVEELELAGAAGHEEVDHALGPRGEMAGMRRPVDCAARLAVAIAIWLGDRAGSRLARDERRQGHRPQPDAAIGEEMPPRPFAEPSEQMLVVASKSPVMADRPPREQVAVRLHSRVTNSSRFSSTRATVDPGAAGSLCPASSGSFLSQDISSVSSSRLEGGRPRQSTNA